MQDAVSIYSIVLDSFLGLTILLVVVGIYQESKRISARSNHRVANKK